MIDIGFIRSFPDQFDKKQTARGASITSEEILKIDNQLRTLKIEIQTLQARKNKISKELMSELTDVALEIKQSIAAKLSLLSALEKQFESVMLQIPNLLADDVKYGESDSDNEEVRRYGTTPYFDFAPKTHYDICEPLGVLDFKIPSLISGSRFSILSGNLARLERAVVNFLLNIHTKEFGYKEVSVPFLVRSDALIGTGQLPKFAEDLFQTTNGMWLIPTAEVYLTNITREQILKEDVLPLRFVSYTQCFRSEAGAAGRDTRGMIRQHQFGKVELVSITSPENSEHEHSRLLMAAETVLQRLNLHYRIVKLCSKDTGFSAAKTYDIEVWAPGMNRFLEISSCSNCTDFQARRMKTRVRQNQSNVHVHTLNGSGVAVGRLLVAIIENYQTFDGRINVPDALKPYLDFSII